MNQRIYKKILISVHIKLMTNQLYIDFVYIVILSIYRLILLLIIKLEIPIKFLHVLCIYYVLHYLNIYKIEHQSE